MYNMRFIDKADDITKEVKELIEKCLGDHTVTAWRPLEEKDGGMYAIVIGYMDGFDEDEKDKYGSDGERLCMKVGFRADNSIMSEYEMDWPMPMVPGSDTNEVWDTEIALSEGMDILETVEWLLKEYDGFMEQKAKIWKAERGKSNSLQ